MSGVRKSSSAVRGLVSFVKFVFDEKYHVSRSGSLSHCSFAGLYEFGPSGLPPYAAAAERATGRCGTELLNTDEKERCVRLSRS